MTGEYQHSIDTKGRLFIPAKLREELGETFYVTISTEKCLNAYSEENWAVFTDKFNSLPYSKTRAMRPIFAKAAKCELDAQGRILIPGNLRTIAGLKKDVTVVGVSSHAEIWDTAAWKTVEEEELDAEKLAAVMDELGF